MLLPHKILLRASEKEKSNLIYQNVEMLQNIPTGSTFFMLLPCKSKSLFSFFFSDKPRAYLCKNFACSAPVETPEELANLIEQEWQKENNTGQEIVNNLVDFIGRRYMAFNSKVLNTYRE